MLLEHGKPESFEQGQDWRVINYSKAALAQSDERLSVNEEINSAFINENPLGIWRIELRQAISISLDIDTQIERILENGFLAQTNRAFLEMQNGARRESDDAFPDFLFDDTQKFLSAFIRSNYRLKNFVTEQFNANGTKKRFSLDVFGAIENDKLLRIWGTQREIAISSNNAVKKSTQTLTDARHLLDALNSLNDQIAVLDNRGEIIAVNKAWKRFANQNGLEGDSSKVGVGTNYLEICLNAKGENSIEALPVFEGIKEVLNGKREFFRIEYPCHSPSEERWFLLTATPLEQGNGAVVSHLDITSRKQMEREREEILAKMHQAYREAGTANRLKDEFLSTISHELRTPLTSIVGWTQMLLDGKVDASMTRHGLETIHRNAQSQAQLIENLLDVSRIITGKLKIEAQPIHLSAIIESAIEAVAPTATAKHISIKSFVEEETGQVYADPRRVRQILWNLLTNAIKFTPRNGEIEVRLRNVVSFAEISVKDTGVGIKPECLPHVFDRFRQADGTRTRKFGGLGLGLAIVRHLVEMHGGTVEVSSDGENKGSTFTFRLPLMNVQVKPVGEPAKNAVTNSGNGAKKSFEEVERLDGARLLVVDDDRDNLDLLTMLFGKFGAKVETASSATEALEKYLQFKPDLVISDIGMPDEDGYSLIRKLRVIMSNNGGQKPAIALTAFAKNEDTIRAHAAGFQRHIKKPVEPAELVVEVSQLLKSWQPQA